MSMGLDEKILEQLKQDSRQSYREIAKKLGVSHSSVSKRIRQLEEKGVIQGYTIIQNPIETSNTPLCIRISAGSGAELNNIGYQIAQYPNIEIVLHVSGECELLALVNCKDRKEAVKILTEINQIPGVEKAESHIILETIKLYGKTL